MATIIESLIYEHGVLSDLFDETRRLLPELQTVTEVRLLIRLVEGVLSRHADVEQNLAYAALDHALAEKGQLDRLYRDHEEIDVRLRQARSATDFSAAVRFFKAGLKASQEHFRREELTIFPLFEKLFGAESLEALDPQVIRRSATASPHPRKGLPPPLAQFRLSGQSACLET